MQRLAAMNLPKSNLGRFTLFFASEMFSFFVISVNGIALIHGKYLWTMVTDVTIVFQGMIVSKLSIENENARDWNAIAGFTFGGAMGSALAIFVAKRLFGG